MPYLTAAELPNYYPEAENMTQGDINKFLGRANSFAMGVIGGPLDEDDITKAGLQVKPLKDAVATAFEIFSEGETGEVNEATGRVTEAAPTGQFTRKTEPLKDVVTMLQPYANLYDSLNSQKSDRGMQFL